MNKYEKITLDRCYKLWSGIVYKKCKGKCVKCGLTACDPHHVFPKGSYPMFKYAPTNGVMLCRNCHDLYHFHRDQNVIKAIIMAVGEAEYSNLVSLSHDKAKWVSKEQMLKELEDEAVKIGIL